MRTETFRTFIRGSAAAVCIVVGLAGVVLPVIPGLPLLGFAAVLLFPDAELTRSALARAEKRLPAIRKVVRLFLGDRSTE